MNQPLPHLPSACALAPAHALPLARLLGHAADAVAAVRAGRSLDDALARCPADARPGTQALAFHALRWLGSAQALRALLAPKPPAPPVDALLLTALALLWPAAGAPYSEHTLVDQAVTAARQRQPNSAGFVNAVLRRFLRERDALVNTALCDPLGLHNHPAWWVERLQRDWPQAWAGLLRFDQQHPPMTLRVNGRRGSVDAYLQRLADAGLDARAADPLTAPQAIALARPCPVGQLPGFADGDVSVQDAAAQRAAPLLIGSGLRSGARVLDACAAPGGKTAHLLEAAGRDNAIDLLALDSDAARLTRVDDTLARLRLGARTLAADAAQPAAWWDGQPFDAILLDAPCSASGIVRRHPDVRWLRRAGDIARLAATQARLLDALWPTLAGGGRLLYCTCSLFRAEGQEQIDAFLQRQAGASIANAPASPGHLLPHPDNPETMPGDGFFYALLEKH